MNFSNQGLDLLKRSEGLELMPYRDTAGLLTIGYGHKIIPPATFDSGITLAVAEQMLGYDVQLAEKIVTNLVKVPLTQGQFDALVDFVFNLGGGRLAHSTLLVDLNLGRYDTAAEQLLLWDHGFEDGKEVELAALKARREAEFALWHQSQPAAAAAQEAV